MKEDRKIALGRKEKHIEGLEEQYESTIKKLTRARQTLEWLEGDYIEASNKGKSQDARILDFDARVQQGPRRWRRRQRIRPLRSQWCTVTWPLRGTRSAPRRRS